MGEIKSTLDLVMEKTKNLNLSDEEKQDQKNKEFESRLNGLLQKYQDKMITLEQFNTQYQTLHSEFNLTGTQNEQLLKVLCARIELGKDNQYLMDLLTQITGSNIEGINSVLQDYDTAIQTAAAAQSTIARDALASAHHISGSAVVPNLETDLEWSEIADQIRAKYSRVLDVELSKIL